MRRLWSFVVMGLCACSSAPPIAPKGEPTEVPTAAAAAPPPPAPVPPPPLRLPTFGGVTSRQVAATRVRLDVDGWQKLTPAPPPDPPTSSFDPPVYGPGERHGGEVVFTGKDISRETVPVEDADLKASFQLGEPIYLRGFFHSNAQDSLFGAWVRCDDRARIRIDIELPGGPLHSLAPSIGDGGAAWDPATALLGVRAEITRTDFGNISEYVRLQAVKLLDSLVEGANRITVTMRGYCLGNSQGTQKQEHAVWAVTLARGTFELHVQPGSVARYRERFGPFLAPSRHRDAIDLERLLRRWVARSKPAWSLAGLSFPEPGYVLYDNEYTFVPEKRKATALMVRRSPAGACDVVKADLWQNAAPSLPNGARAYREETTTVELVSKPEPFPCENAARTRAP